MVVLGLMASLCGACVDNATKLANDVERAAVASVGAAGSISVHYEPVSGGASPYTVLFFPEHAVAQAELVAAGVDKATVGRIYTELAYLGDTTNLLVVEQAGERLTFTSSWRRFARVHDLVVSRRKTGESEVLLRRDGSVTWVVAIR